MHTPKSIHARTKHTQCHTESERASGGTAARDKTAAAARGGEKDELIICKFKIHL